MTTTRRETVAHALAFHTAEMDDDERRRFLDYVMSLAYTEAVFTLHAPNGDVERQFAHRGNALVYSFRKDNPSEPKPEPEMAFAPSGHGWECLNPRCHLAASHTGHCRESL